MKLKYITDYIVEKKIKLFENDFISKYSDDFYHDKSKIVVRRIGFNMLFILEKRKRS